MREPARRVSHPIYAAVALSAALHLSMIYAIAPRPGAVARPIPPLSARLVSQEVPSTLSEPGRRVAPVPPRRAAVSEPLPIPSPLDTPETPLVAQSAANGTETVAYRDDQALPKADLPPIADQQWYEARELDSYPRPLAPIEPPDATVAGSVTLMLSVDETGTVRDASIVSAEPDGANDSAALSAARKTHFTPARRDGLNVRSKIIVKLRFGERMQ
jgi:TonB family protein